MSFGPLKNTSDYNNYVKKYLQTLQLQVAINQKNFDENIAYMKTGVQETERPDSRSIEERAGDVEKLKVQARAMLNKITDATNSTEVLDYLAKNGDLLFFFIQQFSSIEEIVKKQFTGGIRAPLLISLIFKKFTTQQEESLLPESEDFNIVSNLMTKEDAIELRDLADDNSNRALRDELDTVSQQLPTRAEIKRIIDDPVKYNEELKLLATTYKNSLNIDDYNKMLEEYNDAPVKQDARELHQTESDLYDLVNNFLQSSSQYGSPINPLSSTVDPSIKLTRAKSSLARTIPKITEKRKSRKSRKERLAEEQKRQDKESAKSAQQVASLIIAKKRVAAAEQRRLQAEAKAEAEAERKESDSKKKVAGKKIANLIVSKKRGRPVGSKNLSSLIPAAPSATPIQAPSTTPIQAPSTTQTKVASTGSGLLNQKEQDAHRFKVLKGEITAGNKSPELIKELKQLIIKLHRGGELSLEQTAGILKELNTLV